MATYKLGKKVYHLRFDLDVMEKIEEDYGDMRDAMQVINGGKGRIKLLKKLFAWMANAYNEYNEIEKRITGNELNHADILEFNGLSDAIMEAFKESTHTETSHGGEADRETYDGFLDEIDSEERKKKEPGSEPESTTDTL